MAKGARVESIDMLRSFRTVLWKFAEAANVAIADAEAEIHRTLTWLETEQYTFWQSQIRKRTEAVARAKDAVRQKKLFKDSSGRTPSAVDEEKALARAQRQLEEAEQKLVNVRRYRGRLQKELDIYKGSVQRFASDVENDLPVAAARLDKMVEILEAYIGLEIGADESGLESSLVSLFSEEGLKPAMAREEEAAAQEPSELRTLRAGSPPQQLRDAAQQIALTAEMLPAAKIDPIQQDTLAGLEASNHPPQPQDRIIIAKDLAASGRIYLERSLQAFAGDSGWYIGVVKEKPAESHQAIIAADLLALRPDLRDILALAPGFLVVLESGGIVAILDPQDRDIWKAAAS